MERLNKILAHAGVGSRRHCEDLILAGRVTVDGAKVRELGTRVDPKAQRIAVDDNPIEVERPVYWLVNKPRGYLCTNNDPDGRPRAIDLVPQVSQRIYTVGRLDETSEGLLLLTNDGELAHRLMHPRFGMEKTYLVQVAGKPSKEDLDQLLKGVWLSDGHVHARRVKFLKVQGSSSWIQIVLAEGKNREIRRMLARLGHKVMRLQRVALGPVKMRQLPTGRARRMTPVELNLLRDAIKAAEETPSPPAAHAEMPSQPRKPAPKSRRTEETPPRGRPPVTGAPPARRPGRPRLRTRPARDRGTSSS